MAPKLGKRLSNVRVLQAKHFWALPGIVLSLVPGNLDSPFFCPRGSLHQLELV